MPIKIRLLSAHVRFEKDTIELPLNPPRGAYDSDGGQYHLVSEIEFDSIGNFTLYLTRPLDELPAEREPKKVRAQSDPQVL